MSYDITIYIETSKGPMIKKGAGMYMIEYNPDADKGPVTRQGIVTENDTSENVLALKTILAALEKLTKQCDITIITDNDLIRSAERFGWIDRWRMEGWIGSNGSPIKHKELWQQVADMMDRHMIVFTSGRNSYKKIMHEAMEKIES